MKLEDTIRINKENKHMIEDINVILFHATKKDNLPSIMKEGIKPGSGKGGATTVIKNISWGVIFTVNIL